MSDRQAVLFSISNGENTTVKNLENISENSASLLLKELRVLSC